MKAKLIYSNSSTTTNDVQYCSGFIAPDPILLIVLRDKQFLVVPKMEYSRALREVKPTVSVYTPEMLCLSAKKRSNIVEQIQAIASLKNIKSFEIGYDFPSGIYAKLLSKGWKINLTKKDNFPERRIKNKDEVKNIAYSQKAAASGVDVAIQMIASSSIGERGGLFDSNGIITSERVRESIQIELLKFGCVGRDIIVACGDHSADPHERGFGPLFAQQPIILDVFPRSEKSGYWGDITRTVCKGAAPSDLKKMYRAVFLAQKIALSHIRAGISGDEVHQRVCDSLKKSGFETGEANGINYGFFHGTGHGVGLDIHETPRIGRSGEILRIGDVVTVEPGLYYPGIGGVRIEDTVCVKADGYRLLARCPKIFELK
tara:strand:+ start:776 stop:1894 length:1119 start_codon:yes stop_codon:yes gene_type:complete